MIKVRYQLAVRDSCVPGFLDPPPPPIPCRHTVNFVGQPYLELELVIGPRAQGTRHMPQANLLRSSVLSCRKGHLVQTQPTGRT